MFKHIVYIIILTFFSSKAFCETPVPYNGKYFIPIDKYFTWYEDKSGRLSVDEIIQLRNNKAFQKWEGGITFNKGISQSAFWFSISICNITDEPKEAIYKISTGIDTTWLYELGKSKKADLLFTNSRYIPFLDRPFQYRYTAFPIKLNAKETKSFLIRFVNKMSGTYSPMYIQSAEYILKRELRWHWIYGIYFGIFLFIILFNLFLYISMKDSIHLWYAFYVLCAFIFMIQDENFYTEMYPNSWLHYCENIKQFPFSLLMIATGMKVMQLFVKQEKKNSKWYWPVSTIIFLSFSLSAAILIISFSNSIEIRPALRFLFTITDIIFPISILFLIISVLEKIIQKQYLAVYYFIAVILMLIGAFNYYFNHLGITNSNHLQPNGIVVGLAFEIITLSLLLTLRYAKLKREKEALISQQKQQLAEAIIESQEIDRARVARDLHDGVGSSLTGIRLMLENYFSKYQSTDRKEIEHRSELMNNLKLTSTEVRSISHDLCPKDMETNDFFKSLQNIIDSLNSEGSNIEFSFIKTGKNLNLAEKHQISIVRIVKELLNNIIKHSEATKALLQCMHFDNTLQLIIEDNGKGFKESEISGGIGLRNIRLRIDYMNGKIFIDSGIMGTTCLIEIPINGL